MDDLKQIVIPLAATLIIVAIVLYFSLRETRKPQENYGFLPSQQFGIATSSTNKGSTSATATLIGATGRTIYISDVTGATDLTGVVIQVKDGSTVIWQDTVGTTTAYSHTFGTSLRGSLGNNVSVSITGNATSTANIGGYYTP